MILVDTSVWIDFFQGKERAKILTQLLLDNCTMMHPYVQAELVFGGLSNTTKELINTLKIIFIITDFKLCLVNEELRIFISFEC